MKIHDITNEEICKHGRYYCSTDKKWKCRQGPKQTRKTSEGLEEARVAVPPANNVEAAKNSYNMSEETLLTWHR